MPTNPSFICSLLLFAFRFRNVITETSTMKEPLTPKSAIYKLYLKGGGKARRWRIASKQARAVDFACCCDANCRAQFTTLFAEPKILASNATYKTLLVISCCGYRLIGDESYTPYYFIMKPRFIQLKLALLSLNNM